LIDAFPRIGRTVVTGFVVALAMLVAGGSTPAAPAAEELFVSNYPINTISVYPRTASGDVAPIRTIQTGLDHPHQIAVDVLHQELFVANNVVASAGHTPAVVIYDLNASYPLNDTPKRIIAGPSTGLEKPTGIHVDMVNLELYVSNDLDGSFSVVVYPLSASGDASPIRTIKGPLTGLHGPVGMVVDHVHDELIVVNYKVPDVLFGSTVSTFSRTANGDVAPLRVIKGLPDSTLTFLREAQAVALDLERDEIAVANSLFLNPYNGFAGAVMFFHRTDTGNAAPAGEIFGTAPGFCNPVGMVLDLANDEYVVANSHFGSLPCDQSVKSLPRTERDNAMPLRTLVAGPASGLANPTGVAITTRTVCSDPAIPNGTPCDDQDACTQTDTCQAGACVGSNPVVCSAPDQCHVGVCNPATGACASPARPDGALCDDGNTCTVGDVCSAGTCVGVPGPPSEVNDSVRVTKVGPVATISWTHSPGPFQVYRGLRLQTGPWSYNQTCFDPDTTGPTTDASIPAAGNSDYYLVSRKNACNQESVLGRNSLGEPATNPFPCP
jgi:hypothetical protein